MADIGAVFLKFQATTRRNRIDSLIIASSDQLVEFVQAFPEME